MQSLDVESITDRTITACHRCLSTSVSSIRIPNVSLGEAVGNALVEHRAGRTTHALQQLFGWVCAEAATVLRGKYRCDYCHYTW